MVQLASCSRHTSHQTRAVQPRSTPAPSRQGASTSVAGRQRRPGTRRYRRGMGVLRWLEAAGGAPDAAGAPPAPPTAGASTSGRPQQWPSPGASGGDRQEEEELTLISPLHVMLLGAGALGSGAGAGARAPRAARAAGRACAVPASAAAAPPARQPLPFQPPQARWSPQRCPTIERRSSERAAVAASSGCPETLWGGPRHKPRAPGSQPTSSITCRCTPPLPPSGWPRRASTRAYSGSSCHTR
jgi:hypothetical protein